MSCFLQIVLGAALLFLGAHAQACEQGLRAHADPAIIAGDIRPLDLVLLQDILTEAGCKLILIDTQARNARRQNLLRDGLLDIITVADKRPEREAYARFSRAYRNQQTRLIILAARKDEIRVNTAEDILAGRWNFVVTGSFTLGETFDHMRPQLRMQNRLTETLETRQSLNLLRALPTRADVLVDDLVLVSNQTLNNPQEWAVLPLILSENPVYLEFSRKTVPEATVQRIDQALHRLLGRAALRARLAERGMQSLAIDRVPQAETLRRP